MVSVANVPSNLFGANIRSTLYLLASGMRAERSSRLVVALSVSMACAMLSPQRSLRSSGVVRECLSLDKNILGGCISWSSSGPGNMGPDIMSGAGGNVVVRVSLMRRCFRNWFRSSVVILAEETILVLI